MDHTVVVLGTGRIVPGVAAAFSPIAASVTIAGRGEERARAAASLASELAGREILTGAIDAETLARATLVIETIVEDLTAKQRLLELVEPWIADDALIVSNTSSLLLDEIAASLRNRPRFAGWHVMFPAHLTRVLEIVAAEQTSDATMDELIGLATRMGKQPIVVRRANAGYVLNRIQAAVLRECLALVEEGVADAAAVDAAVADGLAPRWLAAGPLGTADAGGVNTFQAAARQLFPVLSTASEPHALLMRASREHGLYDWTDDERSALDDVRRAALAYGSEIADRRPRPQAASGS